VNAAALRQDGPPANQFPVHVELLRHFRVTSAGTPVVFGHAGERLVAYVALENRSFTRDQTAGTLWPESSQSHAAANLRRTLSLVRARVPGLVRCDAHRLSLEPYVSVDVRQQRCLIEAITAGEQTAASSDEARLLRGDLLPDWEEPWLEVSREELRQLRLISLEALASAHLAESRLASALATALCAISDDPLRESAYRLVVQANLAHGNWAEAARQYERYRSLLWIELGLRPGALMEALMRPVLRDSARAT
jgi:DNA-binding SARP family transcriptional activator